MPLHPFTLLHPQKYLIQLPTYIPHLPARLLQTQSLEIPIYIWLSGSMLLCGKGNVDAGVREVGKESSAALVLFSMEGGCLSGDARVLRAALLVVIDLLWLV